MIFYAHLKCHYSLTPCYVKQYRNLEKIYKNTFSIWAHFQEIDGKLSVLLEMASQRSFILHLLEK
jgi:hypothetical protein